MIITELIGGYRLMKLLDSIKKTGDSTPPVL